MTSTPKKKTAPTKAAKVKPQGKQVAAKKPVAAKKATPAKAPMVPAKAKPAAKPKAPPAKTKAPPKAPVRNTLKPKSDVALYQIYYREDQKPHLDPDMEPYNNIGNANPLLEFNVFSKLLKSGQLKHLRLWGALSWKFSQKSGLTGKQLLEIIRANPGYDVYYTNPSPQTEAIYHNLWLQGETSHPDFLATARAFFKAANLPQTKLTELQPSSQFSTANFFVGNQRFWDAYVSFVETTLLLAAKNLPPEIRQRLLSSSADPRGVHFGASYLPFIVERLFPIFMATSGSDLDAYRYGPATPAPENVHLQLLRQMKDVAVARNDKWLAVCWVNYRNLYLDRQHGPGWMKQYAASITPLTVAFAPAWE